MKNFVLICMILSLLNSFCKCNQKSRGLVEKLLQHLENVRNDKDSQSTVHYHQNLDYSLNEGLISEEVRMIANRCQDSVLAELYIKALESLENENDGDSNCILSNSKVNSLSTTTTTANKDYVLCAEKRNGKYNIVSAEVTQIGKIDWAKTQTVNGLQHLGRKWIDDKIYTLIGSWYTMFQLILGIIIGAIIPRRLFMSKADNVRILEEFKERLVRDPICASSSDRINEIFNSYCGEL